MNASIALPVMWTQKDDSYSVWYSGGGSIEKNSRKFSRPSRSPNLFPLISPLPVDVVDRPSSLLEREL